MWPKRKKTTFPLFISRAFPSICIATLHSYYYRCLEDFPDRFSFVLLNLSSFFKQYLSSYRLRSRDFSPEWKVLKRFVNRTRLCTDAGWEIRRSDTKGCTCVHCTRGTEIVCETITSDGLAIGARTRNEFPGQKCPQFPLLRLGNVKVGL